MKEKTNHNCSLHGIYTPRYVETQLEKFRNRHNNHFANHIRLAKDLVAKYGLQPPATLLDIGCSIGTFALEFALDGYKTIGLDLDPKSLEQGRTLAKELGCNPEWICADAGNFGLKENVDIVVCFDLLEHLDDSTITSMLNRIHENLKDNGIFVFHTFPTKYNHVFYKQNFICVPLIPFGFFPPWIFSKIVAIYSLFLDLLYLLRYGKTYKKVISKTVHPNPLSENKLKGFLEEAGFEIFCFDRSLDLVNPLKPGQGVVAKKHFSKQPIAQRSLFGVARKKHE